MFHTDYDDASKVFNVDRLKQGKAVPISVLLALTRRRFMITPRSHLTHSAPDEDEIEIEMNPGDMIVFRGDVGHRGAKGYDDCMTLALHHYGNVIDGTPGGLHLPNSIHIPMWSL